MDDGTSLGEIGQDRLLDGRLLLHQPKKGHRAGSDAILLAAALPPLGAGPLLDMGAGVGTVGLAAAMMQSELKVVLVERDPALAALAVANAQANDLSARVSVIAADIEGSAASLAAAGLAPGQFGCIAMNPPFYAAQETRPSPIANRRAAHVADGAFGLWLAAARRLLRPGGEIAIIHRASALGEVMAGLARGFGGVTIRPVHGMADRAAIRILVTGTLNSRKPAEILPAFVLNGPDGDLTAKAQALHRGQGGFGS